MSAVSPSYDVYFTYDIPIFEYAKAILVLRDFYLKEKVSNKDLEAECRIYAHLFKDKEWPKDENQKGAPILSSLYKVAVTSGITSTRVERVFSSSNQVDSPQR